MTKRKLIVSGVALAVLAGIVVAVISFTADPAAEVSVAESVRGDLSISVVAAGRVESGVRVDVFPPTAGVLDTVDVRDGEQVAAGQLLAAMETDTLDLAVSQAKAAYEAARMQLAAVDEQSPSATEISVARITRDVAREAYEALAEQATNIREPSQQEIDAAADATLAAKAIYEAAESAYTALSESVESTDAPVPGSEELLLAARITRDQAYAAYLEAQAAEDALASFDPAQAEALAQAEVDQARIAYLGAQATYERLTTLDLTPQRRAAAAAVAQAQKALELAEASRAAANITAPIDGIVLFNAVGVPAADGSIPGPQAGALVAPQTAPFTVVDFGALAFSAEVDEVDIERISKGMRAVVRLDAFPDEEFSSAVESIQRTAQITLTGATVYPVTVGLSAIDREPFIGMRGDVNIAVEEIGGVVIVPIEALLDDEKGTYVFVVEGEVARRADVILGRLTETEASVESGLAEGAIVVVDGAEDLMDGQRVTIR